MRISLVKPGPIAIPASPRFTLAVLAFAVICTAVAIYPHLKKFDYAFERELITQYKLCVQAGNGLPNCMTVVKTMRQIQSARENANSPCEASRAAALESCAREWENTWYDSGDENYPAEKHVRDLPRCERIGQAAFNACHNF